MYCRPACCLLGSFHRRVEICYMRQEKMCNACVSKIMFSVVATWCMGICMSFHMEIT